MAATVITTLAFTTFRILNEQTGVTDTRANLDSFTLSTKPITDIWRKPPGAGSPAALIDTLNAPCFITTLPLKSFHRARVTLTADWNRLYDQGGLVFLFPAPAQGSTDKRAWVKTGIEMYDNTVNVATVATDAKTTSDWSLVPVQDGSKSVTIEITREQVDLEKGKGSTMFVHLITATPAGEKRTMIREVTWAFAQEEGNVDVGVYTARPIQNDGEGGKPEEVLKVTFSNLIVEQTSPAVKDTPNSASRSQLSVNTFALAIFAVGLALSMI